MAASAALIPLITGAVGLGTGIWNTISGRNQSKWNTEQTIKANKELAQYQYGQEMEQLRYMNQYNTPVMQRQRLEEAGLNPALMYKGQPQNVQTQMPKYNRPEVDYNIDALQMPNPMDELTKYHDIRIKQAQSNNLAAQEENIAMDTALKSANAGKAIQEKAKSEFDLQLAKELKDYSLEFAKERNWKLSHERVNEALKNEIMRSDKRLKDVEYEIRREELKLRKRGIYPGDSMFLRMMLKNTRIAEFIEEMINKKFDVSIPDIR